MIVGLVVPRIANLHAEHPHGSVASRLSYLRTALFLSPPFTCHRLSKEGSLRPDVQPDVSNIITKLHPVCRVSKYVSSIVEPTQYVNPSSAEAKAGSHAHLATEVISLRCITSFPLSSIPMLFPFLYDDPFPPGWYLRCLENIRCLSVTTSLVDGVLAHWFCPVQREEMGPTLGQVIEVLEVGLDTH